MIQYINTQLKKIALAENIKYILGLLFVSVTFSTNTVIVFLKGTGCAGKTSICTILKSNGWNVVDDDAFFYEQGPLHWKTLFPKEFESIEQAIAFENIFNAVVRNQVMFKHSVNEQLRKQTRGDIAHIRHTLNQRTEENTRIKKEWLTQLRKTIINTIEDYAQQGNVIVDTWFLEPQDIEVISNRFPAITILAYSPLIDCVHRTIKRNTHALLTGHCINNMRFFHQSLMSFPDNFELSDNPQGSIDTITKYDLLHAFDIVTICLHNSPDSTGSTQLLIRGEFSKDSFKEYTEKLLSKFGSNDFLYVIPKIQYTELIRTTTCTSSQAAQQIIQLSAHK